MLAACWCCSVNACVDYLGAAQAERAAREAERLRKEELGSEEDEEELRRQRAWDDWKDANPVGWGNSKTKPCG